LVFYVQVAILLGMGRKPIDIEQHMLVKLAPPSRGDDPPAPISGMI